MQKFKEADGGNPNGTAKDGVLGVSAGTKYLSKVINDNNWNLFNYVIGQGYDLIDDDLEQLTKVFKGKYDATYEYNTSSIGTQAVSDIVEGSNGMFYECLTNALTGEDPVGSTTGDWKVKDFEYIARREQSVALDITSDVDYTLTDDENSYGRVNIPSGTLTVQRNIIVSDFERNIIVVNNSGFTQTVKTAGGTGIDVLKGETVSLYCNSINVIRLIDAAITTESTDQTKLGSLTIGESLTIPSWSFVTTTITINTSTPHNMKIGDTIYVSGLVSTANVPNGSWTVLTIEDTDTITFIATDIPTGSPTVSSATVSYGEASSLGGIGLNKMVLRTAVASTSGTSIDFIGIPSWVKKVSILFNGVSTTGTDAILIQMIATTAVVSGYGASGFGSAAASVGNSTYTNGIPLHDSTTAGGSHYGTMDISLLQGFTWSAKGIVSRGAGSIGMGAGGVTLPSVLTGIRITTFGGVNTFDAGLINIMYEG